MKKKFLLPFILLLISTCQLFAQNQTAPIEIKKGFGTKYIQNGIALKPNQMLLITEVNEAAYAEMKTAKTNYTMSQILGFAGGFLVGWPLGTSLAGGDPNWTLAGVGAGIIAVSIPFSISFSKHAKKAVEIYNEGLNQSSKIDFQIGTTKHGIGITMNF